MSEILNGVINIYKEKDFTSNDVVAKLRGILKMRKIGHTGTLDPDAEGVLPVCLGNATKLFDILTDRTKEYETVLLLGKETDTQDISGEVLNESGAWKELSEDTIISTIKSFEGGYDQIPPMYSALKVNGKKLYELAREGKVVEREPRFVDITNIEIKEIDLPRITMKLSVSKGTYIRTICNDIGNKLGCFGTMEKLLRTRVGTFNIDKSLTLSQVEEIRDKGELDSIITGVTDLFAYPKLTVKATSDKYLLNGNVFVPVDVDTVDDIQIDERSLTSINSKNKYFMVYISTGQFIGIYEWINKEKKYKPYKMFL